MGHVSASAREAQTKLTITSLHGAHDPHACAQSGRLDPATSTVSKPLAVPLALRAFSDACELPVCCGTAAVAPAPALALGRAVLWRSDCVTNDS